MIESDKPSSGTLYSTRCSYNITSTMSEQNRKIRKDTIAARDGEGEGLLSIKGRA